MYRGHQFSLPVQVVREVFLSAVSRFPLFRSTMYFSILD